MFIIGQKYYNLIVRLVILLDLYVYVKRVEERLIFHFL